MEACVEVGHCTIKTANVFFEMTHKTSTWWYFDSNEGFSYVSPNFVRILSTGMHHLLAAFLLFVLLCTLFVYGQLDDSIIVKDLYAVLGVKKDASIKQIQKSFRKLARKLHPDKSKPDDAKRNEKLFREVAEAYEVLSSQVQRSEYDKKRKYMSTERSAPTSQRPQQQRNQNRPNNFAPNNDKLQEDWVDSMFNINSLFEPSFEGSEFPSDFYQPSVVGSVLHTGQVHLYQSSIFHIDITSLTSETTTFPN